MLQMSLLSFSQFIRVHCVHNNILRLSSSLEIIFQSASNGEMRSTLILLIAWEIFPSCYKWLKCIIIVVTLYYNNNFVSSLSLKVFHYA